MATKKQLSIPTSSTPHRTNFQLNGNLNQSYLLNKSSEQQNQSSDCKTELTNSYPTTISVYDHSTKPFQLDECLGQFRLNDLVWAKLKNSPWWPCQIVRDLIDNNEFCKMIGILFF